MIHYIKDHKKDFFLDNNIYLERAIRMNKYVWEGG